MSFALLHNNPHRVGSSPGCFDLCHCLWAQQGVTSADLVLNILIITWLDTVFTFPLIFWLSDLQSDEYKLITAKN